MHFQGFRTKDRSALYREISFQQESEFFYYAIKYFKILSKNNSYISSQRIQVKISIFKEIFKKSAIKSFRARHVCSKTFFCSSLGRGGITGIVLQQRSWPLQATILLLMKGTGNQVATCYTPLI